MFNRRNLLVIYIFYIAFISLSAFLFAFLFQKKFYVMDINHNIILENITFEFGELIKNLFYSGEYFSIINNVKFYLNKLPAIPLLLLFISKISLNYFFVVIIKNIITFSVYFLFSYFLIKNLKNKILFFLILIVPIVIPYSFSVALNYVYEDNLIALLLPLLFLSLVSKNKNRFVYSGVLLFILYFVKTSMFLLVLIVPFLIIFFERKIRIFVRLFPLLMSILAIIIWGYFGYSHTGRFPFGSAGASNNSYVLSFALNKDFKNYYPERSTDLIPISKADKEFMSEWELYDYYKLQNKNYLKSNFSSYLKDIPLKLNFIFFGIHVDGINFYNHELKNTPIRYSSIFSKFFLNLAILISAYILITNFKNFLNYKKELYFIAIFGLNLVPHLIGWATSKHLIAISNTSLIYLLFYLKKKYANNI
jgi:hypothetical protein